MKLKLCPIVIFQTAFVIFSLSLRAEGDDLFARVPIESILLPQTKEPYRFSTVHSVRDPENVGVIWHPDGKTLACVSRDNDGMTIETWDIIKGSRSKRFSVAGKGLTLELGPRFMDDGKALVAGGYRLDMSSGRSTNLFNKDRANDFSLEGSTFSPTNDAILWSDGPLNACKTWITISGHGAEGTSLNQYEVKLKDRPERIWAVGQNGQRVLLKNDKGVFWYNLKTEEAETLLELDKHKSVVLCRATNPNGTILATGDSDGVICTWDINSMKLLKVLRAHLKSVQDITFSADGQTLCGIDEDSLSVWDIEAGKKKAVVCGGGVVVAPSPDGSAIAVVSKSGRVEIVDWKSSRKKGWVGLTYDDRGSKKGDDRIVTIKWQSDANTIFAVSDNMRYYAIEKNGKDIVEKKMPGFVSGNAHVINDFYTDVHLDRYSRHAATFNFANGKEDILWGYRDSRLEGDGFKNGMVQYGNGPPTWIGNGDTFVCGIYGSGSDKKPRPPYKRFLGLFNVNTSELSLNPLDGILGPPPVEHWQPLIAVSKDTKMVAFVCEKVAEIVDIAEKKLLHRFNIAEGQNFRDVYDPLISPDGRFLFVRVRAQQIAGGLVESFKAWDLRTGQSVDLPELTKVSGRMAMSPDGSRLAVRLDHQIALWAIKEGTVKEDRVLNLPWGGVNYDTLSFSPDGKQLVAFEPGGLRFWSVSNDEK